MQPVRSLKDSLDKSAEWMNPSEDRMVSVQVQTSPVEKYNKQDGLDEDSQLNVEANTIETTLFLQNHEKISLISSFGPIDAKDLESAEIASTSTFSDQRQCRICLLCHETKRKRLISPCRCSGSIKFAHNSCLVRWIDASANKRVCPARCELCGFRYKRRSFLRFDLIHVQLPKIGLRDKVLNLLFILLVVIMSFCSWVSLHYLGLSIRRSNAFRVSNSLIGEDDMTMLAAALLFFVALFLAIFTQYRAENSVLHVLARCWHTNRNWQISEYDPRLDFERLRQKNIAGECFVPKSSYHNY